MIRDNPHKDRVNPNGLNAEYWRWEGREDANKGASKFEFNKAKISQQKRAIYLQAYNERIIEMKLQRLL